MIIVAVLIIFSMAISGVSYSHQKSTLHKENEGFVHNVATFYLEQQLKVLENTLWQNTILLDSKNVEALVNNQNQEIEKKLTTSIAVMPSVSGYIVAKRDGRYNSIP